jgi:hypothetical protein
MKADDFMALQCVPVKPVNPDEKNDQYACDPRQVDLLKSANVALYPSMKYEV